MKSTNNAKKLAMLKAPTIQAVVGKLLRLASEEQALEWMQMLERNFTVSKSQIDGKTKQKSLILWIRDYELTSEEKKKGYLGNFAAVSYKQSGGKWTLYPTKIYMDLKQHPQRKYQNAQKHPNWGHPVLRAIKNKTPYKSIEAADRDLQKLHEQYPIASIPGIHKLYLMVFSKAENPKAPVVKYVFEIKARPEGGFYIDYKINVRRGKKPSRVTSPKKEAQEEVCKPNEGPSARQSKEEKFTVEKPAAKKSRTNKKEAKKDPKELQGYFTSMVELRRSKRKKK